MIELNTRKKKKNSLHRTYFLDYIELFKMAILYALLGAGAFCDEFSRSSFGSKIRHNESQEKTSKFSKDGDNKLNQKELLSFESREIHRNDCGWIRERKASKLPISVREETNACTRARTSSPCMKACIDSIYPP